MALRPIDPLAHRALEALVRAEATLTRRLAADLDRIGVSATGFAMLVLAAESNASGTHSAATRNAAIAVNITRRTAPSSGFTTLVSHA